MKDVFVVSDNILSPVGHTSAANFTALLQHRSGIKLHSHTAMAREPVYASLFTSDALPSSENTISHFSKFEKLLMLSIQEAIAHTAVPVTSPDSILILSSTKGNISLLETETLSAGLKTDIGLSASARKLQDYFRLANTPLVISNACISGLTALLTGKRLLEMGQYKHAIIAGADVISSFIMSGFQSFQAVSRQPCRPFDAARNGINLGEAAATLVLSTDIVERKLALSGGAVTNDANHISGPSRSGEELCMAVRKALKQSGVAQQDIGFISAHGTATLYNDEMEAKAFSLAGMESVPLHSLKGYYGHTLGAAGVLESVIAIHSLEQGIMIATRGFENSGVSKPINVIRDHMPISASHCLKTASGFGGCNAALVFSKTA